MSFHKHPHKSILSLSGILFNVFFYSNQTLQLSTLSAPQGFIGQYRCGVVAKATLLQLLSNKSVIPPKSCTSSKYSATICSCEINPLRVITTLESHLIWSLLYPWTLYFYGDEIKQWLHILPFIPFESVQSSSRGGVNNNNITIVI